MKSLLKEIEELRIDANYASKRNIVKLCDRLEEALLHIQELREGLEFYAEEERWASDSGVDFYFSNVFRAGKNQYGFEKARALLEKRMSFEELKEFQGP